MSDAGERFRRLKWMFTKLETNWDRVDEMMLLQIKDGLGAMAYGQFGGSFPDPTAKTVINGNPDRDAPIWARDSRAEDDRKAQLADFAEIERITTRMDDRRRAYMAADRTADGKLDIRLRLDPNDWCYLHWHLALYEGHRRHKDGLCKVCLEFRDGSDKLAAMGRVPTTTEIDYWHTHGGNWPHRPVDPKARAV